MPLWDICNAASGLGSKLHVMDILLLTRDEEVEVIVTVFTFYFVVVFLI